jgi:putative membrane protein
MGKFIAKILIAAAGLWLAATFIDGIDYHGWLALLLAGLLLGLVNAIVRPIVTLLTLPITLLTLGLFLLVINAAMIGLVGLLVPGFDVDGFIPAILAAVVTGVVSWVGQALMREG